MGFWGYAVSNQEIGTGVEVVERIHLVEQLALLMPKHASFTATSDLRLSYDIATLHCGQVGYREALAHRDAISAIALHHDSVPAVELEAILLEVNIQWYFLPIM